MNPASQAHIHGGLVFLQQRRYPEAANFFRKAIAADPRNAGSYYHLAVCQREMKQFEEAEESLQQALALLPNEPAFHSLHSLILSNRELYQEAVRKAEFARSLDPRHLQAYVALAMARQGECDWVGMEEVVREALAIEPNDIQAANLLAHALRLQGRLEEHAQQINTALIRDPANPLLHTNAGWAALQKGERKEAETHFREALRLRPDLDTARQGLFNSFKARSAFYRTYLRYCLFLQRWDATTRFLFVMGVYFAGVFLLNLAGVPSQTAHLLSGVFPLLILLWAHLAPAVGNLIIWTDPFARHALRPMERKAALFSGGAAIIGCALWVVYFFSHQIAVGVLGLGLLIASLAWRHAFSNVSKEMRWLFGIGGVVLIAIGITVALKAAL